MAYNDESPGERARHVVRAVLPDATWAAFMDKGSITFRGKRGEYIISPHTQTEIREVRTGRRVGQACLQLSIPAPACDRMITEYLLLKNAEDFYWQTANIFGNAPVGVLESLFALLDIALLIHLLVVL
jgi:hypothetical protein